MRKKSKVYRQGVGGNKAALTHQEHDTINLPKGNYKVTGQVEYTPERLLRVAD